MNLNVKEMMTFVPSGKDYKNTLAYYKDLGFTADYEADELSIMRIGSFRFFLQNFANAEMQSNFMMNIDVEDLDAWWHRIQESGVKEKYPGTRAIAPKDYPWGKREIHLIGPDGVLWHIAVRIP